MTSITTHVRLLSLPGGSPRSATRLAAALREHGAHVESGPADSLRVEGARDVFAALNSAFRAAAERRPTVMLAAFCSADASGPMHSEPALYAPIGHVENDFDKPTPAGQMRAAESRIVLSPEYEEGLDGLTEGARVVVLFHFHRSEGYELLQSPRGDATRPRQGVFSLRSPRRPNPIGATVTELVGVQANVLRVRGLDALNKTPVLDLKMEYGEAPS
ncbi:tRNA (N6-threonylcarbamoyladenosine(37)-N6)-methyltransferase TrmO [Candidatus Poribacteria bacterium]|jgi:tRNA (adenine37-N6)-methyltransferase|nr:tRNA (N6-threonylcarbamoyladenosine(37)-N6)-methyltransferase TrmO [Candidatus Poribacteria bacterium]